MANPFAEYCELYIKHEKGGFLPDYIAETFGWWLYDKKKIDLEPDKCMEVFNNNFGIRIKKNDVMGWENYKIKS